LTLGRPAPTIVGVNLQTPGLRRASFWLLGLGLLLPARAKSAETLDGVVSRAIAALGGAERLRACQTRLTVGKISFDGGSENPFTVAQKRPNRLHMEIFFPSGVLMRGFDGSAGWQASPFAGRKDAYPMSPEERGNIGEEAEFDDPLLDWKARGSRVELLGKEPLDGRFAYRLRVTTANGLAQELWLDSETFLRARWQGARKANGREMVFSSSFGDYRTVDGLQFPFRTSSRSQGNETRQEIVITRVELDMPIEDAQFALPKPAAEPAGKALP
jgi:hypothetical protein